MARLLAVLVLAAAASAHIGDGASPAHRAIQPDRVAAVAARQVTDSPEFTACQLAEGLISACSSATPNFFSLAGSVQASCICCDGTSWLPGAFDGVASICVSYISTALPASTTLLSDYRAYATFCTAKGNVCLGGAPAAPTPTPTPTPATPGATPGAAPAACTSVANIVDSCISAAPQFTLEPAAQQASCICYQTGTGGLTWNPDRFGNYAATCAAYVATASPTLFPLYTSLASFCFQQGDVAGSAPPPPLPVPSPTNSPTTSARRTTTVTVGPATTSALPNAGPGQPRPLGGWAWAGLLRPAGGGWFGGLLGLVALGVGVLAVAI